VAQEIVTITRRPTPAPTPRPTPRITPPPNAAVAPQTAVRAPAPKAAATPHARIGGAAAPKRLVLVTPRPRPPEAPPDSLAAGIHQGRENSGSGSGAGPGTGTSGLAGTANGSGTTGTGNAGDANSACGAVTFEPGRAEYEPDGTVLQYVIAKVTTPGDVQVGVFPYPFSYPNERQNPFRHLDVKLAEDNGIPVQMPPAGFDPSTAPPAVQLVLKYTNPLNGHTTLPECAAPSS